MSKQLRSSLLLLVTAMVWGLAFVAQDVAADSVPSATFNAIRMALGSAMLLPVIFFMDKKGGSVPYRQMAPGERRALWVGGALCGTLLALASYAQQLGIALGAGPGKAAFITALYIVLVPLTRLIGGRGGSRRLWIAVILCAVGLYLLCIQGAFSLAPVDWVLMLCALGYTGQILAVDHYAPRTDCVKLSCVQFASAALVSGLLALLTETTTLSAIRSALIPILYAGIFSTAVGYTLQVVAQKDADPSTASLIMSCESIFALLFGWILLGDTLSLREIAGCVCMAGAIVMAQVGEGKKEKGNP